MSEHREVERRTVAGLVELRAADSKRVIAGYASKFDRLSKNLGGFVERVAPTFFNRSHSEGFPGVVARYNHNDDFVLGSSDAQTLRLEVRDEGLWYEVDPPKSREDIVELVERGDVRFSSFAFRVDDEDWGQTDTGYPMRTLKSGTLVDVSPVIAPAYLDTTAALASLAKRTRREVEEVRSLAIEDALIKILPGGKPKEKELPATFGPAAKAELLEKLNADPLREAS